MGYSVGGLVALSEAPAQVLSCTSNAFVYGTGGGGGLVADNGMGLVSGVSGAVQTSYSTMPCLTKDGSLSSGSPNDRIAWKAVRYVFYPDAKKPKDPTYDPNTYGFGVPLSPDQMKHRANFIGWDFSTVWAIREGQEYPHLQWEDADDK
jgi:hypothetical protein